MGISLWLWAASNKKKKTRLKDDGQKSNKNHEKNQKIMNISKQLDERLGRPKLKIC